MNTEPSQSVQHRKWRPGTHWGRTIVAMGGEDVPHDDDMLVGMMLSAAVAAKVCEIWNRALEERERQ